MRLDEDSFRALARSSPWRWRSLHLTRRGGCEETVEAWVTRPGKLVVRDAQGRRHREGIDLGANRGVFTATASAGASPDEVEAALDEVAARQFVWAGDVEPVRRLDGLVAHRPADWWVAYEAPIWENYRWAAMLDPVELADGNAPDDDGEPDDAQGGRCDGTIVTDLRVGEHRGRQAWRATVAASAGYDPLCGCCPLLWSRVADVLEYGEDADPTLDYPVAFEVALDVETGIVVELIPLGGECPDDTLDLEVHQVG